MMSPEFDIVLKKGAGILGFDLSPDQIRLMKRHAEQLSVWNKKMNLTAITTPDRMAEKHFIDSISAVPHIPSGGYLADLGSGGGFPGIPVKIMCPDLDVTLVDASQKKVNFLRHVIRTLELKGIDAVHRRAEDLHHEPGFANRYHCVISRAFTHLETFTSFAAPLLASKGVICAMKGRKAQDEFSPALESAFQLHIHPYQLPFEKSARKIVMLQRHSG